MAVLRINRAHGLAPAALRERVEQLAAKLVARYGGAYQWQGSQWQDSQWQDSQPQGEQRQGDQVVRYRRPGGVDAEIHCGVEELRIVVTLGPLAGFLRGTIERELNDALDRYLRPV